MSVADVINPATEQVIATVPAATVEETDEAIQRAHAAWPAWRDVAPGDRANLLRRFSDTVRDHVEELALRAGVSLDDAECVWRMSRRPTSLDQPVGEGEDSVAGDFVRDHREDDALVDVNRDSLKSSIAQALAGLSYREREIIRLRFGLADGYAYTLEEVGSIFDVTRERVRQIEAKAVEKLRQPGVDVDLTSFVSEAVVDRWRRSAEPQLETAGAGS